RAGRARRSPRLAIRARGASGVGRRDFQSECEERAGANPRPSSRMRGTLDCSGVAPASSALLYAAGGVRPFVIGFTAVALGLYLAALGYDPALVGGVVASGLAGNAVGVALVAGLGERLGRRRTLIGASVLGAAGLGALAAAPAAPFVVGLAAFLGVVNGMGRDP